MPPVLPPLPMLSTRAVGSYADVPALAPDPYDPEGSPRYDGSLGDRIRMLNEQEDAEQEQQEEDAEALHRARLFIAMFNGGAGGDTQEATPPVLATAEPAAVDNEGVGLAAGATMRL